MSMQIHISNLIEITDPTKEILDFVTDTYVYNNPSYEKKRRMGFYLGKTPKTIRLYEIYNDNIYLPCGVFNDIWKVHPHKEDYQDYTVTREMICESKMQLREYQKLVPIACKKYCNGLILMPCGTGKSITMLQTACYLKQKTLWLCTTKDLLQQAESYITKFTNATTSRISEGKCDTSGNFVFATMQTLYKIIEKGEIEQDVFGCVIADEVQHCMVSDESIMQFKTCFEYFCARYKFGCTATLMTSNPLWKCIPKIIGDILYELKKENDKLIGYYENKKVCEVPLIDFQIPIRVNIVRTDYSILDRDVFNKDGMTLSYAKLITDIGRDSKRNKQIIDIVNALPGSTLILSDRVEQLKILHEFIPNSVQIDGSTNKKVREQAIDDVRSGKIRVLLASYQLAKEGLDIIRLENLVMGTPVKDFAIVVQSCGRIQRPFGNKKIGTVYDLVDDVSFLNRFYSKRKSIYKKEQWEVIK